jgi:hypothetical protein
MVYEFVISLVCAQILDAYSKRAQEQSPSLQLRFRNTTGREIRKKVAFSEKKVP